ncbi:hypothetical protein PHET_11223 [Paragonimus heterotremus]|uniref:F-box domain-containing protein n=1 Tax=Paragonimus heterotremus TaxID=100268 RepID=A0A8J4SKZ1_9TREM|nr:hypothetical protein PHET_11223 [Paragonimus heterotremus]
MNLETDENNGDCGFASEAQIDTSTSDDFDNPLFDQPKRVCWRGHTKTNLPFFDECLTPHIQDTNTRDGASDPSQSAISIHLCSTQEDRFVELSAIVDSCCHAELVYLHQTIEPLLKRDFVCQLPLELSLQILSYLSLGDILRCAKVSHSWNRVVSDQLLWYRLCRRDRVLSSTTSDTQVTTPHPLLHENLDWKSVYRVSLETQCNWRNGSPWAPVILPAHHVSFSLHPFYLVGG